MIILVDMDDVIVDMHTAWVHAVNKAMGWNIKYGDLTSWEHTPENVWNSVLRIPGFFLGLDFVHGARSGLVDLGRMGHHIFVVSAPTVWEACRDKYHWVHAKLKVYNIIPGMHRLVLTRAKYIVKGDVLIDDNPENLESWGASNESGYCILYARPWNREYRKVFEARKNYRVVWSWDEIVDTIRDIAMERSKSA